MNRQTDSRVVLTYGTFDLFHVGHLNLLQRAAALGHRLLVGVSTDEFNAVKGKTSVISFKDRAAIVSGIRGVHFVFPEHGWEQKRQDIHRFSADVFVMGDDWQGRFDDLQDLCEVIYLARTPEVSSSSLKDKIQGLAIR